MISSFEFSYTWTLFGTSTILESFNCVETVVLHGFKVKQREDQTIHDLLSVLTNMIL